MSMDPTRPPALEDEIRDLRRRLSALERANPLRRAAARDESGVVRLQVGAMPTADEYPPAGDTYGLSLRDADGELVLYADDRGVLRQTTSDPSGNLVVETGELRVATTMTGPAGEDYYGMRVNSLAGGPTFLATSRGQMIPATYAEVVSTESDFGAVLNPLTGVIELGIVQVPINGTITESGGDWQTVAHLRFPANVAGDCYIEMSRLVRRFQTGSLVHHERIGETALPNTTIEYRFDTNNFRDDVFLSSEILQVHTLLPHPSAFPFTPYTIPQTRAINVGSGGMHIRVLLPDALRADRSDQQISIRCRYVSTDPPVSAASLGAPWTGPLTHALSHEAAQVTAMVGGRTMELVEAPVPPATIAAWDEEAARAVLQMIVQ